MTNKERSVEEIVEYVETLLNKEGQQLTEDAEDYLTQTLQAERQKREEMVEAERVKMLKKCNKMAGRARKMLTKSITLSSMDFFIIGTWLNTFIIAILLVTQHLK